MTAPPVEEITTPNTNGDRPDVIKFIYSDGRGGVVYHSILLDDDIKKLIVHQTWDKHYPLLMTAAPFGKSYDNASDYVLLAHASAKLVDKPCTKCEFYPALGDCRVNAIWPARVSCTSCMVPGGRYACSLGKMMTHI